MSITFSVVPCFLAILQMENGTIYMVEELMEGEFKKYMSNDGKATIYAKTLHGRVCMALAHWSLSFGKGKILVTDLQGVVCSSKIKALLPLLYSVCSKCILHLVCMLIVYAFNYRRWFEANRR